MEGNVSKLELQRKSCRLVVGIEGVKDGKVTRFLPKDFDLLKVLNTLSSDGFRYYAIIHDKDEGEYKHIHLVLISSKTLRLKQFFNAVVDAFNCDTDNVSIRETTNLTANIQYLVHKNEGDKKHHYDYEEVLSNDDTKSLLSILQDDNVVLDDLVSTESLIDIIKFSNNRVQIICKLGYKFYNSNNRVIMDLMREYHPNWFIGN